MIVHYIYDRLQVQYVVLLKPARSRCC